MFSRTIGNDIVDLKADLAPSHHRFANRVFTSEEREFIGSDRKKLWLCWAAKEAAYKALKRIIPDLAFSPLRFNFNHRLSTVCYKDTVLYCKCKITDDYVCVVCQSWKEAQYAKKVSSWTGFTENHISESESVRELMRNKISSLFKIKKNRVEFTTQKSKIPCLIFNDNITTDLLSFSHHGRYVFSSFFTEAPYR